MCTAETCTPLDAPECETNLHCDFVNGYTCNNGDCMEPDCVDTSDCDSGYVCEAFGCEYECEIDTDCDVTETCESNECVAIPDPECTQDSECSANHNKKVCSE